MRRILLIAAALLVLCASPAAAQEDTTTTTTTAPAEQFTPLDEYNYASHPISSYDVGWKDSADGPLGVLGLALALPWDASRYVVAGALWFTGWVFDAEIAHALAGPAAEMSRSMDLTVVQGLDLRTLAFFVLAVVVAVLLVAGRPGRAVGEVIEVLVVLVGGGILVANLSGVMEGSANAMSGLTGAAFQSISNDKTVEPVQGAMQRALIEAPWEIVNWGRPLRPECAAAADKILSENRADAASGISAYDVLGDGAKVGVPAIAQGPAGAVAAGVNVVTDEVAKALVEDPRETMSKAGCEQEANTNAVPSTTRIFSAWLNLLFVALAAGLLLITATAVAVAQVGVIGVLYLLPFIVIGGIFNRGIVAWFATQLAMYFGLAIGGALALVFHLGMLLAVMGISSPIAIYSRWALSFVVAVAGVVFFRRIIHAFRNFSVSLSKRGATAAVGPSKVLTSGAASSSNASQLAMLGWQEGAARRAQKRLHDTRDHGRQVVRGGRTAARRGAQGAAVVGKGMKGATIGVAAVPAAAAVLGGRAASKAPKVVGRAARSTRAVPAESREALEEIRGRAVAVAERLHLPTGATRRRSSAAARLAEVMGQATADSEQRVAALQERLDVPAPPPEPLYVNSAWERQWAGSIEVGADDVVEKKERLRAARAVRNLLHRPPEDSDIDPEITGARRERILHAMDAAWERNLRRKDLDPAAVRAARALDIEHDDYVAKLLGDQMRNVGHQRAGERIRRDGGLGEAPPETRMLTDEPIAGEIEPRRTAIGRPRRSA